MRAYALSQWWRQRGKGAGLQRSGGEDARRGGGRGRKQAQTLYQLCQLLTPPWVGGQYPFTPTLTPTPLHPNAPSWHVTLMLVVRCHGQERRFSVWTRAGTPAGLCLALCHTQCTIGHQCSFSSAEIRVAWTVCGKRVLLSSSCGDGYRMEGERVQWAQIIRHQI